MKKIALLVPFAAAGVALAACGSGGTAPASTPQAHTQKPSTQQVHHVGDSVTTKGVKGPVKITVTGVAYPDYPKAYKTYGGPGNKMFVVISYRAQALKQPTTLGAPIVGAGFSWRGNHQVIKETDGNGTNPPWVGRVPEATSTQPIQPSMSQDFTTTLDVPSKGGKLSYAAPGGKLAGTWQLPSKDVGPAADIVAKAMKEFLGSGSTSTSDTTSQAPTTEPSSTAPATQAPTQDSAPAADTAPGCGQRAVNAGKFNPSCSEYQGYLDPGKAGGREPNSGDKQLQYGCEQGYIPKSQCPGN